MIQNISVELLNSVFVIIQQMTQFIIIEILSVFQFPLCLEIIFLLSLTVSYFKTFS